MQDFTPTSSEDRWTLQFIGDVSLNGPLCDPSQHVGLSENLAEVAAHLGPCDLRVGNWESPLWGDGSVNELKDPRLCTTRAAADHAVSLGLDVGLLANNHAYDCHDVGFRRTVRYFDDHGIRWLGAGTDPRQAARPLVVERRGGTLGLLNYVGDETHPNLPPRAGVHLNRMEEQRMLSEVRDLSARVDAVVAILHWGAVERILYPTTDQRRLARGLIEAGASLVVGGHAHCLQGDEAWRSGHIFYGLGNFLFGGQAARPGQAGTPWPAYTRLVGVPTCTISRVGVHDVRWTFLFQDGLRLRPDDRRARARRQRRISAPLAGSDRRLARVRRLDVLHKTVLLRGVDFLRRPGWARRALVKLGRRSRADIGERADLARRRR